MIPNHLCLSILLSFYSDNILNAINAYYPINAYCEKYGICRKKSRCSMGIPQIYVRIEYGYVYLCFVTTYSYRNGLRL